VAAAEAYERFVQSLSLLSEDEGEEQQLLMSEETEAALGAFAAAAREEAGDHPIDSEAAASLCARVQAVVARLEALDGPQLGLFAHVEDENEDEGIWLVKPSGEACGRGIAVVKGWEALEAEVMARRCSAVVVQKYVERPLTLRPQGRKFDLRLWVLVTSLQPLAVWEFSQCYLRVAARPLAFDAAALADPLTHLTNYAVQRMAGEAEPTQGTADEGWGRDGWWNDRHPFAAHTHNPQPTTQPTTNRCRCCCCC